MLTMQSQPGDYIGQGQSYNLTYTGSDIVAQVIQTVAGSPAEIDFILWPTTNPFALLYFGTNQLGNSTRSWELYRRSAGGLCRTGTCWARRVL